MQKLLLAFTLLVASAHGDAITRNQELAKELREALDAEAPPTDENLPRLEQEDRLIAGTAPHLCLPAEEAANLSSLKEALRSKNVASYIAAGNGNVCLVRLCSEAKLQAILRDKDIATEKCHWSDAQHPKLQAKHARDALWLKRLNADLESLEARIHNP